jgi:phosphatidylglycerol:prolipoprotein diacylglycerol transferase
MEQVLLTIPIKTTWTPDGIPIHAFGVVLFVCFIVCVWFAGRRAKPIGFPPERMQDLGLVLFLCGIIGARVTYMIQYHVPFHKFFNIWEGGIVLYGSIVGGFVGYWLFYFLVLKRLGIRTWQLADALAPALALGIGIGRVGCLLNGCCYGQVAPEQCPNIAFPLTTAPVREKVVDELQYQTVTGFTIKPPTPDDLRTMVARVEKGSNAERAGLLPGDKILRVNDRPNVVVLGVYVDERNAQTVGDWFAARGARVEHLATPRPSDPRFRVAVSDVATVSELIADAHRSLPVTVNVRKSDTFRDLILNWPKGRHDLELVVARDGKEVNVDFTPRSLGLHPTQIYETISMGLLTILLLAYFPFRRHDGQVFVMFVFCYAAHRFLNEILRDDTTPVAFNMTLSQNMSLLMVILGIMLEMWLRNTQPKLGSGKRGAGNGGAETNLPHGIPNQPADTSSDAMKLGNQRLTGWGLGGCEG